MTLTVVGFVVAFAGGIFGAAIGALPAFIFVGFLVLYGAAVQAAGGPGDFVALALGPAFGPHVGGFASGVAAAAYATKTGKLSNGRDIASALMGTNSPDVLLVGGLFGIIGYLIQWALGLVGVPWTDTVALTVVLSGLIVRVIWGNGPFGQVEAGKSRFAPDDATKWLVYQSSWGQRLVIGLGAGLLSSYFALTIGAANGGTLIGFGLSAASLLFLQFGVKVPVTHHITLVAAVAAAASGSFIWGGVFGILAAVVGEYMADIFQIYGDTHIDPPAATIATLTSVVLGVQALGVFGMLALV